MGKGKFFQREYEKARSIPPNIYHHACPHFVSHDIQKRKMYYNNRQNVTKQSFFPLIISIVSAQSV